MPSIAKLVVSLGAQTASFETDMARAAKNQERRMKQMKASAMESGKAIATAFAAAGAAMTAIVVSSAKTADSMAKLGQRLGASTESLSELGHAAQLSGVDFRTLEMGLQRMTRRIGEVAFLGKGEAKQALEILGLEAKNLADLPLDKQFESIAEELSKVENVSQRTSLAMKVFDAEGVKLVQMMEGGASSIQAMREEAEHLGIVIGGDLAANSEQFNDNMTRMGALAEGAGLQFTAGLLPALIGVQNAMLDNATGMNTFAFAGEKVGEVVVYLTRVFTVLWGILRTIAAALIGMAVAVKGAFDAILAPIKAAIGGLAEASKALAAGDFKGAMNAVKNISQDSATVFNKAMQDMERGIDEVVGSTIYFNQAMERSSKISASAADEVESTSKSFDDLGDAATDAAKRMEKLKAAYASKQAQREYKTRLDGINASLQESYQVLEELNQEQETYETSLSSLLDTLYPVEAAGREFGEALNLLTRAYEAGDISAQRYEQSVARLTERFDQQVGSIRNVANEFDLMTTLVDEGARILQRTFSSIWDGLLEGSGKAFDAVKDGFKAMMTNLANQAITQPIILNIQQGLQGQGTGPGGGINYQQLGSDLAAFAGVIAGTQIGGGSSAAAYGSTFGALAGAAIGSAVPGIGTAIGTIAGGIIGGILGGLFNKVFGKNKTPRISIGTGFDVKPGDSQFFNTAFGETSIGDTRGGMDDYVQDFGAALTAFDNSIADFLSDDQIGKITESLDGWSASLRGKSITIEDLLNRRFAWIMNTFSETIQGFVAEGEDLAAKADRLQVAVSAETLIADNPDLFGDRVLGDFLQIVEAFKSGNQTISEAYNEVLELLNIIGPVYESLQSFRDSNLGDDFAAIIAGADATLQEALTGMINGLDDAIRNFDGSPEELQRIGAIVASIREGELKLLAEIDQIQRGISANLAQLKSDLLGIGAEPLTGEQLFNQAAGLIGALGNASTAQEVADIARQFEATIRQMSPEDQARNAGELVRMVEDFDATQKDVLEGMKQAVIDSAADTRAMVDDFIERIGTPLDILVGSNQEVADALGDGGAFEQMTINNETHQDNVEGILEAGVGDIASEVNNIGPVVANALQSALQGTDINVQVIVNNGLVTQ